MCRCERFEVTIRTSPAGISDVLDLFAVLILQVFSSRCAIVVVKGHHRCCSCLSQEAVVLLRPGEVVVREQDQVGEEGSTDADNI